jgi:hypothetical protein
MARQKRSPTFKGHHFSSLAAHKELEPFLRENLSNNFRRHLMKESTD